MSPNPRPMTLTDLRMVKHRPFFARMSYKGSPWRIDVPTDGSYIVWRTDQ